MKILILGGTQFIGPHLIDAAQRRGHQVTLFNRGKTAPEEFADIEQLRGDRKTSDYDALRDGEWNVVIDTCAYWPRAVREAIEALPSSVKHYVFVSTISVYESFDADGYGEDAPLATVEDPESEEVGAKNYGGLKVLCEEALETFEGTTTVVRPGLVAGPRDTTDRFTYWPVRIERGGEVLVPGQPSDPIQYIDVRDLAEFTLQLVDETRPGVFNAVTPPNEHTMGSLIEASVAATDFDGDLTWVDADFLHEHEVRAWNDLPLWVPPGSPLAGIPHCSSQRAIDAGLEFTPLQKTVAETLAWFREERDDELKAGLDAERESALLREHGES